MDNIGAYILSFQNATGKKRDFNLCQLNKHLPQQQETCSNNQGSQNNYFKVRGPLPPEGEGEGADSKKMVKMHQTQFNSDLFCHSWMFSCEVHHLKLATIFL